ncbi:peptidylprolyl isomerase [Flavobacteriaceae bacterium S0825]|uniref:peptidylprolyl isomerase n=1 Tax=Gaetbulibacter sp. S0825 TaxID=2720084 RepID=UPI0014308175|nr:peptidylprolyl isomerase [Gaetbulibacter sp. S0825]MCK0109246.1 peptidylprolyl isomerase [Flavobacteriaceae bacterium S0825]NIX64881.1 peptidylprolyl isomerase [Gaetbulibacter sp. S0825]
MKLYQKFITGCFLLFILACDKEIEEGVMKSDLNKDVEMVTDLGTIILRLSDDTPIHRNNFIKLVNKKYYDSIAFHRIIEDFVIQAGNPTTKPGKMYSGGGDPELNYTIEAEIKPNLFHKRGALAAARSGGISNPDLLSSGLQFYIVQRGTYNDSTLNIQEERVNEQLAYKSVINSPKIRAEIDNYINLSKKLRQKEEENLTKADTLKIETLREKINLFNIDSLTDIEVEKMKKYSYPDAHREVYKTVGGTPHLDQNYTVFGEVIEGMNVVDSIAKTQTNDSGKPINDIRIITARMIKRQ